MPKKPINKERIEYLFFGNPDSFIILWHPLKSEDFKHKVADVVEECDYKPEMIEDWKDKELLYTHIHGLFTIK